MLLSDAVGTPRIKSKRETAFQRRPPWPPALLSPEKVEEEDIVFMGRSSRGGVGGIAPQVESRRRRCLRPRPDIQVRAPPGSGRAPTRWPGLESLAGRFLVGGMGRERESERCSDVFLKGEGREGGTRREEGRRAKESA